MLLPRILTPEERQSVAHLIPGPEPVLANVPLPGGRTGFLPVSEPCLTGREAEYLAQCVETGWVSSQGSFVTRFEETFASLVKANHGIACSSGTTALHLLLAALGIGPGDEVIVPSFTMIAVANCVTHLGAKPVFVDSASPTLTIHAEAVAARISARTRAVIAVHTYGHPCDMAPILEIGEAFGIPVIEDAAEAHGATYRGRPVGSIADAAIFSFYGNKIVTTGEGGIVTTNNGELSALVRRLRDHAFSKERHFWHEFNGFNFRMTNLQAAVGCAQLEQFDEFIARRRNQHLWYGEVLADLPGVTLLGEEPWAQSVFWMHAVLLGPEFPLTRDELRLRLAARGVETRTFFVPLHVQPVYFDATRPERFPVAEEASVRGFYLPSSAKITKEDVAYIGEAIRESMREV